jgi:ribonuclease P protein component
MISRSHRFRRSKDIDHLYRKGKQARVGALSIKALPAANGQYRLAVVVSKKVSKSAVIRNRIRRRLFEQFRLLNKAQPQKPFDVVLSVYDAEVAELSTHELRRACSELFEKITR